MAEKRPPLPEQPLPCPFCGTAPRALWNGGMTIKCTNQECCQPKTGWWYDVAKCVAQWNRRGLEGPHNEVVQGREPIGEASAATAQRIEMTPRDLIDDLRSRINPAYAAQLGTESYERRLCAEALETLLAERDRLKEQAESLARAVMADMGNRREPLTQAQIAILVDAVYRRCGAMQPTPEIIVRAIEHAHGIGA